MYILHSCPFQDFWARNPVLRLEGKSNFSEQVRKLINRYKRISYSLDIMRQTACLVVNPVIVMAMLRSLIARRRFGPQTQ